MIIIAFQALIFIIALIIIVFLIFKRLKDKKKEDFEKRNY